MPEPSPVDPSGASQHPGRAGSWLARLALGLFLTAILCCIGAAVVTSGVRRAHPTRNPQRGEVSSNVDGIKTAQLAYDAQFDTFVRVEPHPVAVSELSPQLREWPEGSGFDTLGWGPDGRVRGTYSVEVTPDGSGFLVHGWIDEDGDGVPAHYTATRVINATRVTPAEVR